MRAAVLRLPTPVENHPLVLEDLPIPNADDSHVLIRVLACGVCRTDLHIVEGELPVRLNMLVPGHQIVGVVDDPGGSHFRKGDRVGVSWMGGVDGTCRYCLQQRENLCDSPVYTGYTVQGGYAEYVTARADFLAPLPQDLEPQLAAPLLCAGIIGFRSLRRADVKEGQSVGLFGFGSSAQLLMPVLRYWKCKVYVATREEIHQRAARDAGAVWVGGAMDCPQERLDAAITFAPSGDVVMAALRSLAKGGILAINAIHLDRIPEFDYDSLLWGEREIRSVANMTRADTAAFLSLAFSIGITPKVTRFALHEANEALAAIKHDQIDGSVVLIP